MSEYEIIYDYTDDGGYENRNCVEEFTGTWSELQACLKRMREQGCYNITAAEVREIDEV